MVDHTPGMINVTAAVNGRKVTLDSVIDRAPLQLPVRRVESSLAAGFRTDWLSGTASDSPDNVVEFRLTSGAGVGSPYMTLVIDHPTLGTIEEVVDMRDALQVWMKSAIAAGATPKGDD